MVIVVAVNTCQEKPLKPCKNLSVASSRRGPYSPLKFLVVAPIAGALRTPPNPRLISPPHA